MTNLYSVQGDCPTALKGLSRHIRRCALCLPADSKLAELMKMVSHHTLISTARQMQPTAGACSWMRHEDLAASFAMCAFTASPSLPDKQLPEHPAECPGDRVMGCWNHMAPGPAERPSWVSGLFHLSNESFSCQSFATLCDELYGSTCLCF